jgi:hypothetical protein
VACLFGGLAQHALMYGHEVVEERVEPHCRASSGLPAGALTLLGDS